MAGTILVSSIQLDSDNNFSIISNTGTTLLSANGSGLITGIANNSITGNKLVANTVTGDVIGQNAVSSNNIVNGTITTTQIASNTISNTNIATGAIENYSRATGLLSGMRNRIINGAMVIDQRNTGASVTPVNNGYTLDRWKFGLTQSAKFTAQQDSSANTVAGFTSSMKITSSSAYSVTSGDTFFFDQVIEGNNVADLRWGTANARAITISFWVRSSLTGQFGGALRNNAADRAYPFSYTIVAANTWEQKFITVAGDTSGTWLTTNGTGIEVVWNLGSGSTYLATAGAWTAANIIGATGDTSVVGTNGATWYITGVQLEVGSTATSFDYRPYGTELALCQRYFEKSFSTSQSVANAIYEGSSYATVASDGAGSLVLGIPFSISKRASPTVTLYNPSNSTANSWRYARSGVSETDLSMLTTAVGTKNMVVYGSTGAAWTAAYMFGQWTASAEL